MHNSCPNCSDYCTMLLNLAILCGVFFFITLFICVLQFSSIVSTILFNYLSCSRSIMVMCYAFLKQVFFVILKKGHYFLLCFDLVRGTVSIIDNHILKTTIDEKYEDYHHIMVRASWSVNTVYESNKHIMSYIFF